MNKNTIILKQLQKHAEEQIVSFHVPGHKNGKAFKKYNNKYFSADMLALDVTELPDTDNLHGPKGIIQRAQKKASDLYHSDHTFFLVNGTSSGNIAALMSVLDPNDKVIIPRDCHKSVMYGLVLGGFIPVYIMPEIIEDWGISGGMNPNTIEETILKNPDVKAVVVTYPNYYGLCSDMVAIEKIVHKYNKILIVDEAHGAHFILNDKLPLSAVQCGAVNWQY